jgi:hypothetical protein
MIKTSSLLALLPLALTAYGCSANAGDQTGAADPATHGSDEMQGNGAAGPVGSVGFSLTLPGDINITGVTWTITGPDGTSVVQTGKVDVHASAGIAFEVTSIPVGTGYRVELSALSVDAGVTCDGDAMFAVMPRATTAVSVHMLCTAAGGGHTTLLNGTSFDCGSWKAVTASPDEVLVGAPVTLTATATGPMPGNLTYSWSAPSGQFGNSMAADTTFTCTSGGTVPITLVVGDGPVPSGSVCNPALNTDTITVSCTGNGGTGDGGTGDGGTPPPPPPAAPALPGWAVVALVVGTLGSGLHATRRRTQI